MYLISQEKKKIMEKCKEVAKSHGLKFTNDSLEYIVTNRDMNDLTPKHMIPTLYDFWVQDVNIIKGHRIYDIFPHNPFETVINTRPPISYYNDNNPNWLDTMIYYHVLGHIDFFQNNWFFENTWNDDFLGKALADKRRIDEIKKKMGSEKRWVDYALEFARNIDNLASFFTNLRVNDLKRSENENQKLKFYFGKFLRQKEDLKTNQFYEEVERHRQLVQEYGEERGNEIFLGEISQKYPEFENVYEKEEEENGRKQPTDILEFILENATYLKNEKYSWISDIIRFVRETSLYFYPQMITKIMNEGWASYWHQTLFEKDDALRKHMVEYAKVNSSVMQLPKRGLNPYAIGYLLFDYIDELSRKGQLNYEFEKIKDINERTNHDSNLGNQDTIFDIRKYFDDFTFIQFLDKKNFQEFVNRNNLFVMERRLNPEEFKWEYYVKSRNGEDYREMLMSNMNHPPKITIQESTSVLNLTHEFEGKPLVSKYIPNVLIGLEWLWNGPVTLDTTEIEFTSREYLFKYLTGELPMKQCVTEKGVRYHVSNRRVTRSLKD